ncbi:OmpA family protein [Nafulsella turpanensis]|uniref:OmpA family protein n=1 Tax=Nafulsella turpanensis TaxID=1265690 RepID=UPI00034576C6|nr:OmpA family protein [Nafulsella turpanensis]
MRKNTYFLGLIALFGTNSLWAQDGSDTAQTADATFNKTPIEDINSEYLEVRPLVTDNGEILFFNRRFSGKKDQDIYVVEKNPETGEWGEPRLLGDGLNNRRMNAVASANPSGKELVLFNTYKGTDNVPLVRTIKENGSWSAPEEINIQGYENFSPYSDFFVDYKKEVLLMAIQPKETEGGQDLFVSFPQGESGWSEPLNMGPVLNSAKDDFAPFMGADTRTLFFSSYGHDTGGGSDIFMSVRLDDSWTNWSEPVKLGEEINTEGDENYFSMDKEFNHLYYTSQIKGEQDGGIIEVQLPEDFTAINGPVLSRLNGVEIKKIMDSGNYEINPAGRKTNAQGVGFPGWPVEEEEADTAVVVEESAEEENPFLPERLRGFQPVAEVSNLSAEAAAVLDFLEEELPEADLAVRLKGDTAEFKLVQNILYDFNSVYPQGTYYDRLNNIKNVLKEKDELKLQLIGHTDSIGSAEVNEEVARLRVANIRRYLTERGVSSNRIEIIGAGQGEPVAPNETDEGRDLNRRVETIIRFIEK